MSGKVARSIETHDAVMEELAGVRELVAALHRDIEEISD